MIQPFISALYHSKIPLPKDTEHYKRVLEDIEHFSICPQVLSLLKQSGEFPNTPPFFQDALKQQYHKAMYQNVLIKKKMEQVLAKFEVAGIPVIPLKGVYFAEKYFGHIGARWTSDIDLLIKRTDLELAIKCIRSLGFIVDEEFIPSHFHCSFSKPIPHSPIPLTVELHWDLLKQDTSQLNIAEFWNEAKPIEPYKVVMELSDYHTFYMICLHGWRHHLNSLKHFLDILQMVQVLGPQLDYERLFKDAFTHKTLNRIHKTLAIVYRQFPELCPAGCFSLHMRNAHWWEYEAIRIANYKTYRQYVNLFYFEFLDYDTFNARCQALFKWLLPSKDEIAYELGSLGEKIPMPILRLYQYRFSLLWKAIIRKLLA